MYRSFTRLKNIRLITGSIIGLIIVSPAMGPGPVL